MFAINPTLFRRFSYDPLKDFAPVTSLIASPLVLVVPANSGASSVRDLVNQAKTKPGGLNYASQGSGSLSHVGTELFAQTTGTKITHVPYRGVGPSVTDVVAGHVDTAWVTFGAVRQYLDSGKLIALAVGDGKRTPLAPSVPTLSELGYQDVVVGAWNGFFAPKGTPASVVKLLNEYLNAILKEPEVVEKLKTFGALPAGGAPSVLAETNKREYEVMGKAIKDMGIVAE